MPTSEDILKLAKTIVAELDHYGRGAPFIAYVHTAPENGIEHVFITKDAILPEATPSAAKVWYARYRLPLGRIAETPPGQVATVRVVRPHFPGEFFVSSYQILSRNKFRLKWTDSVADAIENSIDFPDGDRFLPALREWVGRTLDEIAIEASKPRRRPMAERLELAETPVTDSQQGAIWRTDIRRFMVITGAPGTGKTTTAIKRIAQIADVPALVESSELSGFSNDKLRTWFGGSKGWALFTPSDLLRSYLHQSLAEERLVATEERVPVWETRKNVIAREVLRLVGPNPRFSMSVGLVADRDSKSLTSWTLGFQRHFAKKMQAELRRATKEQVELLSETCRAIESRMNTLRPELIPLQEQRQTLEANLEQAQSEQARDDLHRLLRDVESRIAPGAVQLDAMEASMSIWREVVSLGDVDEHTPLGRTLIGILALKSKFQQLGQRLRNQNLPDTERTLVQTLVAAVRGILTAFSDEQEESLDSVFRKLPIVYQEYRLLASEGGRFYHRASMPNVSNRQIDPLEFDTFIYVALDLLRAAFGGRIPEGAGNSITARLSAEFRYLVAVDEATDFSAVELACMRLLAHPTFDCVTFAGDPMQRMTAHGISNWNELSALVDPPEVHNLRFSYRQSQKLLAIAKQLYEHAMDAPAPFKAGFGANPADPDALRYQSSSPEDEANWIAERIVEFYRICGERLRSIAVLVTDESEVIPMARRLKTLLYENFGDSVEDCPQGRILGTQAKVRVFSVQFIKGLEFEAVFFAGVDRMALTSPSLVDKFLYVGLTRARSFLAITHMGNFPIQLRHVAELFKTSTWQNLLPPPETAS